MRNQLHPDGPECSKIALGLWRLHEWDLSPNQLIDYVKECIDVGITTFDHADIYGNYGNEAKFGEILKEKPKLRDQIEIVSKTNICLTTENRPENEIQHYNSTSGYIRKSVERSLKQLQTDRLDLLLIHRPDPLMDAGELAQVFSELIDEGKILHAGVSNFTRDQFQLLQSRMDTPLVTNQVEFSLLHTNPVYDGTFDQAQELGIAPMIWSPFAGGRMFWEESERAERVRNLLHKLSEKYSAGMDQIALAWILKHPCRPLPVIGTGRADRARGAAGATNINLGRQDWFRLLQASRGHGVA